MLLNPVPIRNVVKTELLNRFNDTGSYIGQSNTDGVYNYQKLFRQQFTLLSAKFTAQGFDISDLSAQIAVNYPINVYKGTPILFSKVQGISNAFSQEQLNIVDAYISNMYNATNAEGANQYYTNTYRAIESSSSLSSQRKIQLITFIEQGNEFAKNVFSGSYRSMLVGFDPQFPGTTSSSCDVDWRSVWAGAVVGAAVGAVRGAVLGGTGGTVALPGFGTVTGILGGAVFGGAGGFIGGALTSIASGLLTSCYGTPSGNNAPNAFEKCRIENPGHPGSCLVFMMDDDRIDDKRIWYTTRVLLKPS